MRYISLNELISKQNPLINLASSCRISKVKISAKISTKPAAQKLVPDDFLFAKN